MTFSLPLSRLMKLTRIIVGRILKSIGIENEACESGEAALALLLEAARTLDVLEQLAAVVDRDGVMVTNARGEAQTHPAVVEGRQQRLALARIIATLRLPEDAEEAAGRPQRRGAARGFYTGSGTTP